MWNWEVDLNKEGLNVAITVGVLAQNNQLGIWRS